MTSNSKQQFYVVIGTAPTVDTSVVVGPFRSRARVAWAEEELTARGFNTETCQVYAVGEVPDITGALDWGP